MRQWVSFVAAGLLQLALDWLVFVSLTYLGVTIGVANVLARTCGAGLGYILNGKVTFASDTGRGLGVGSGMRFVASWCALTGMGTLALLSLNAQHLAPPWFAKLVVEGCLAIVSFLVMRAWIYKVPARKVSR